MQGINEIYAKNLILGHISKFKAVSDWKTIFKFCFQFLEANIIYIMKKKE